MRAQATADEAPPSVANAAELASRGRSLFAEGRVEEALAAYESAIAVATDGDRPVLVYDAATCLFELERWSEAKARFLEAASLDASLAPIARLHAGIAAAHAGELDEAERLHAESAPSEDPELVEARAVLEEAIARRRAEQAASLPPPSAVPMDTLAEPRAPTLPTPRSGFHGLAALSVGWDSNPAQSGGAATASLTGYTTGGSAPFVLFDLALGYEGRFRDRHVARIRYLGDVVALATSASEQLSTISNGLDAQLELHISDELRVRPAASGYCSLIGLTGPTPWLCGGQASLRVELDRTESRTLRFDASGGYQAGLSGYEYLSGAIALLDFTERFLIRRTRLDVGLRGRYLGLGTLDTSITPMSFPACNASCIGATYAIPVGYLELAPHLDVAIALDPKWTLRTRLLLEARRYDGISAIDTIPESAKRRVDFRIHAAGRIERELGSSGHLRATAEVNLLGSVSNIAYDPTQAAHEWDYNDRTFFQALMAMGIEADF